MLQNKLYQCWSKYFIIIIVIIIIITTINIIIIKLQSFIINPIDFNTSYREEGGGGRWGACNRIYFCCLPLDGPVTGAGANADNNNDDDDAAVRVPLWLLAAIYSVIMQIVSRQHSTGLCGRRVEIEPCTHFPRTYYACSLFFCRRMC